MRANAAVALIENGKVYLPASAPWLEDLLDEVSAFPAAPHDDWTDTVSQAMNFFRVAGDNQIRVFSQPGGRDITDWIAGKRQWYELNI